MEKGKGKTSVAEEATDVNTVEVVATEVVATEEVLNDEAVNDLAVVDQEEIAQDAELIPSGVFIAESGAEYEFTVDSFMFKGKKYDKAEALKNPEVLETLVSLKSFILKQL